MNNLLSVFAPRPIKNILFVCTGNSCRSVFAEGVFKGMLAREGIEIHVHSAGTRAYPGRKASLRVLRLLRLEGIDLNAHFTRRISRKIIDEAEIIFVMESAHREAVLDLAPEAAQRVIFLSQFYSSSEILPLGTEIPDPIGMDDFFYENVNDIIRLSCQSVLSQLKREMPLPLSAQVRTDC